MSNGQDVNQKTCGGNTALHGVIYYDSNGPALKYLLQMGADPKIRNDEGLTPVEVAERAESYGVHNLRPIFDEIQKR